MPSTDAATVNDLVHLLDRTERLLITFYYVDRLSLTEIALVLDLAPPRVVEMLRGIRRRVRNAVAGAPNLSR